MNQVIAIAGREFREKSRVFLISAALAVMPFVAAALPISRGHRMEVIAVIGGLVASNLAIALAIAFGCTTIASDLAQNRISFYFSKPVAVRALWTGKAVAATATSLAALLIVAVPSWVVSPRWWKLRWLDASGFLVACAIGVVLIFLASHVLSTFVRSGSPLLGVDFVLLLASGGVIAFLGRALLLGGAVRTAKILGVAIAGGVTIVAAMAPVWQLENGRADFRRSHAALSRFLWSGVAMVLLAAGAFVFWFVSVSPNDLERVRNISQPAGGDSLIVTGKARDRGDYGAGFVIDSRTGEFRRLEAAGWGGARFSRDGSVGASMQPVVLLTRNQALFELHVLRKARGGMRDEATGIRVSWPEFVLSDDGSRIAIASRDGVVVYDLETMGLLASVSGVRGGVDSMFFVSRDLVRLIQHPPQVRKGPPTLLRIFEFDAARRKLTQTGERLLERGNGTISASLDGSRMLVGGTDAILDGRTGERIASIPGVPAGGFRTAMLNDGSIASIEPVGDSVSLRTFDRVGTPRHTIPLPGIRGGVVAAEIAGRKVVVWGRRGQQGFFADAQMIVVDVDRGVIERVMKDLRGPMRDFGPDPRLVRYDAGQDLAAVERDGRLVLWNPSTGEKKALLQ